MSNGRCRIHGGASLSGTAHPRYKDGKRCQSFSASLPHRLRERFEQAQADPELLSHRNLVALYDVRVIESLERWGQFDSAKYRQELEECWQRFELANAQPADTDEARQAKFAAVTEALTAIKRLIESGGEEAAAWAEVNEAIKNKMTAAHAEHRRLVDMKQMLTVEQALEIVMAINEILVARLQDRALLALIGTDIERRFGLATIEASCEPADEGEGDHEDVSD